MNGKFEEKLARLAFGDLSPEEAARIESQAAQDPEAARALETFREMRSGLKAMATIPDDQLSKERLRDAILAQGLRPVPERARPSLGWLWMPVAACTLAFGLMTFKNRPTGEPVVMIPASTKDLVADARLEPKVTPTPDLPTVTSKPVEKFDLTREEREASAAATTTNRVEKVVAATAVEESKPRKRRVRRARQERKPIVIETNLPPVEESIGNSSVAGVVATNSQPKQSDSESTVATLQAPPTTGPIVLIDAQPDANTGAPAATEVGSATNVLVGG